jgi:xanthine/uracil/vitamin C permease (AzgA family)
MIATGIIFSITVYTISPVHYNKWDPKLNSLIYFSVGKNVYYHYQIKYQYLGWGLAGTAHFCPKYQ